MAKYRCNYCQGDISGFRFKCNDCPDFDLCLQCFSCGAEVGSHKKDHKYLVLNDCVVGAFDIQDAWTLVEETMLLDAVEQYGLGNWDDVGSHVETKSAEECEEHYNAFYVQGNIGKVTFYPERTNNVRDHSCPDGGPLSPSITLPVSPIDLTIQEQQELGYMPLRDDFERENDNDAETLVSSLANNYDDEDIDIAVKLAQVDRYRTRLKERDRRKKLAREYGLIQAATSLAKQKSQTPKRKKEEREFQDKMRVFAQFHSAAEHEAFFENIQKEKELKSRIKELTRYRKHGITKLDGLHFPNKTRFNGFKKGRRRYRRKIRYTYRRRRIKR